MSGEQKRLSRHRGRHFLYAGKTGRASGITRMGTAVSAALTSAFLNPAFAASDMTGAANSLYSLWITVAITGGAIGLARCAIGYMLSDSQTGAKTLQKAVSIVLATVAACALPTVINVFLNLASGSAWSPADLG